VVGSIAAICTSLVTFLGPLQKAERYSRPYHILDQACLEFEAQHQDMKGLTREAARVRRLIVGGEGGRKSREEEKQKAGLLTAPV
jgi:hypothetical protein